MTIVGAAFVLGLVGSLHCVFMCGPLLALTGRSPWHQLGRVVAYAVLGAAAGHTGHFIADVGLRRALSIALGLAIVIATVRPWRAPALTGGGDWLTAAVGRLGAVGRRLNLNRWYGRLALGMTNALLPCGSLYAALAMAAVRATSARQGAMFMLAFGAGTVPALLVVTSIRAPSMARLLPRWTTSLAVGIVGLMLIGRGLSVEVPLMHKHGDAAPPASGAAMHAEHLSNSMAPPR